MPVTLRKVIKRRAVCLLASLVFVCASGAYAAETLFERAKNLYDIREYKIALAYFQKVIESEPENGEAWDFAGWCNRYNGDWNSALKTFAKAKELLPGEEAKWVFVGEGETYYGAGVCDKSIEAFKEAIALAPGDEELVTRSSKGMAFAYAAMGDKESLELVLGDLRKKYPDAVESIKNEADILLAKTLENAPPQKDETIAEEPEITDSNERLTKILGELTSGDAAIKQEQTAEPDNGEKGNQKTPASVKSWEFPVVGAVIEDALENVSKSGVTASKEEVQSDGLWLYRLTFPPEIEIPDLTEEKADSKTARLEEFNGKLLCVVIANNWVNHENSVVFKNTLFAGAAAKMNSELGSEAVVNETDLLSEAQWISADQKQAIVLNASATLEGNTSIEIVYNDIPGLNDWLEAF